MGDASKRDYWWVEGMFGQPTPRPEGFESSDAEEFDVIVVGSGMAGFTTAILSHDAGSSVLMLEASDEVGGTTYKSGAGLWVPNNAIMRALGISEDREECLRYMARVAHPDAFDPDAERYGMGEWEWEKLTAFFENAAAAIDALVDAGALEIMNFPSFSELYPAMLSYHCELDMSIAGFYRHLLPKRPDGSGHCGHELIRQLAEAAKRRGIELRTQHRVTGVIEADDGEVVGVTAETPQGEESLYARQGVVFATGGFPHNLELVGEFFRGPLYSSCAVASAQGDFVNIGRQIGAELAGMGNGWLYEDLLEKAAPGRVCMEGGINVPAGDSMIYVDRNGRRFVDEKRIYQERSAKYWDPGENGDYPDRVRFMVYDETVASSDWLYLFFDTFKRGKPWVIQGQTLEELAANVSERLATLEHVIGDFRLAPDFASELAGTIERFNGFARNGEDEDFHRGEILTQFDWHGPARPGNDKNPTMYPLSDEGPYYCVLLCGMVLDTNGGPKTNSKSEVLRADGSVIKGLYGAGNCVAAVAGEGYFSGGSTLGPAATFAYLAARNVTKAESRDLSATRAAVTAA
jgi:succinate dehydrogenase/fumarate reductase flavoprotein subunit